MKKNSAAALLGALAIVGCAPEETTPSGSSKKLSDKEFTVICADTSAVWTEGDTLAVVDALGMHPFTALSSGSQVVFSGQAAPSSSRRYAVYPASSFVSYDKINVKVSVPSVQSSFEPLSVAMSSGENFEMKKAAASVSFTVASKDIAEIVVEAAAGENLSGEAKLSFSGTGAPSLSVTSGSGGIKVLPLEGNDVVEPGRYEVSCLPGAVSNGIDVKVCFKDGGSKTFACKTPSKLACGDSVDFGDIESGVETKKIEYSFYSGTFVWPFASPGINDLSTSILAGTFQNQATELKLSSGENSLKVYSTLGLVKNSTQGFRFGGGEGDYLELPAFEGLYLTQVSIVTGSTSSSMIVCAKDGASVVGGQVPSTFGAVGDEFTWTLYGAKRSETYRMCVLNGATVGIRKITLRYDYFPVEIPEGGVKIADEIADAATGEARYEAIYNAHVKALSMGIFPDYTGVGTVELTVPASPKTIPLGRNNDFKGTVFKVRDDVSDGMYIFSMVNPSNKITLTGKNIDNADYSSVSELRSGLHILRIQDDSLWVANREGHDYGATRRDAVLVRDGKGSCEPCYSYSSSATRLNCAYCETDDEQKTFCNVSLIRDPLSTKKICLLNVSFQNNLKISNVLIETPQDNDWYGDHAINILYSTNILCEDLTFNGTYSQTGYYGYGLACNCLWNATFRRITSHCRWGVFGCNNMHDSTLEDSDCERFDTHCYGKNITVRNSTITGRGIPVASIYGTILVENSKFVNCYFYSTRPDYNSYVPFDLVIKNCELTPKGSTFTSMGRLNTVTNARPELAKKCWPNVTIDGLTVNVPAGCTTMYLFSSDANNLGQALGYISDVSIKGLEFKYGSEAATVDFYISQRKIQTEGQFKLSLEGLKIASPYGTSPAKLKVNVEGNPGSYSVDSESDVRVIE